MMLKINNNFKKGISWSLIILAISSLLSYLTFIPKQTFAADTIDPAEHRSLSQISTMQEMSQQVCINSYEEETKQLRDTRDSKTYWVAKLKDGNCWMTQNLDFDIPTSLNENTSNVNSVNMQTGITGATSISDWPNSSGTSRNYADPGDFIYSYSGYGQIPDNTCTSITTYADPKCSTYFTATTSTSNMHYHVGNFYTFSAATLGSIDNQTAGNASISICPKGWLLPTGGLNAQLMTLVRKYDFYGTNLTNDYGSVYANPLYIVYSGYLNNKYLHNGGRGAMYWSSTAATNSNDGVPRAFILQLGGSLNPHMSDNRYYGYSVRCLALGGWPTDRATSNLTITVSPTISLDVTADAIIEDATFTKVSTSNIKANVSSNYQYTVSLSTNQSNLELATPVSGQNIPMIKDGENVVAGTNGWGIMQKMSALDNTMLGSIVDNINNTYSPVGIGDEQIVFYKSAGPEALTDQTNPANPLTLKVGVGISPQLPQGTYSTTVTLTASTY